MHSLTLQIGIELFSEGPVLTGVADETGVIASRLESRRVYVLDEGLRNASLAQEVVWNVALGAIDGCNADVGRCQMCDRVQSFDLAQINIGKMGPSYSGLAQVGFIQIGSAQIGSVERGFTEVGSSKVGSGEASGVEV